MKFPIATADAIGVAVIIVLALIAAAVAHFLIATP